MLTYWNSSRLVNHGIPMHYNRGISKSGVEFIQAMIKTLFFLVLCCTICECLRGSTRARSGTKVEKQGSASSVSITAETHARGRYTNSNTSSAAKIGPSGGGTNGSAITEVKMSF